MDIKVFVNMMKNMQKFVRVKIYRGENAFNKFLEAILKEQKLLTKIMKNRKNIGIIKTEEDKPLYEKTNICHICLKEINNKKDKFRDLCNITGLQRGLAHVNCDFNYKLTNKIPVVFFNLRGYDCSFIMQEIGKFKDVETNFIPSNTENI